MYVVMYHYVRSILNSRYPNIKGMEMKYFKDQLRFFSENGFSFLTLRDVLKNKGTLPDKSVLLTFDDGYIDHYLNVFPLLDKFGIQGVFSMPGKIIREKKVLDVNKIHYILASAKIEHVVNILYRKLDYYRGNEFDIPSNEELFQKLARENRFDNKETIFIKRALQVELPEDLRNKIVDEMFVDLVTDNEKAFVDELYMNMDQIEVMKKHGMEFGFHGYEHYWMNRLDEPTLRKDIENALDVFQGILPCDDWTCCYPYGSYSDDVIDVIKQYGATSGFITEVAQFNPSVHDLFKIPRLDTNDFPPKSEQYLVMR